MTSDCNGQGTTRRERLLDWMRGGDPSVVPVMMSGSISTAASYYGIPCADVAAERRLKAALATGVTGTTSIGSMTLLAAIPYTDRLSLEVQSETLPDGTVRETRVLTTPAGALREVYDTPLNVGAATREFYVKGEEDLPAFESFVRIACKTILGNPEVSRSLLEELRRAAASADAVFPTVVYPHCPAFELLSSMYNDQEVALFLLHDHRDLMEELYDLHWRATELWMDLTAKVGVDIYHFAINGLEWLSPDIYERYMIPQAKRIVDFAEACGKLSWIHTCGKMGGLIDRGVYRQMGVRVVESLSAPPTGTVTDYARAREMLGPDVATRGGVNCELFYGTDTDTLKGADTDALKARCHEVLDGCRGFRHMIGDTNGSVPVYQWETIQVLLDVVRERGASFS